MDCRTHWPEFIQIISRNPRTPSDRDWFTQRIKHPNTNWVVSCMECSKDCADLFIGETKQQLHKGMSQHRRATSSGQDSAVHLHLKEKGHSCEDSNVHILDREDRWFEVSGFTFPAPTMQHCLSCPGGRLTIILTLDSVTKNHLFRQVDNSEVIKTLTTCTLLGGQWCMWL